MQGKLKTKNLQKSGNRRAHAFDAGDSGVFEGQFFAGIDKVKCRLTGQGGFVKTAQDQFQLAFVGVDIADGKNAGYAGAVVKCVHGDRAAVHAKSPFSDRAEFGREPEKGQKVIGFQGYYSFSIVFNNNAGKPLVAFESDDLCVGDEIDFAALGQVLHFFNGIERPTELRAPVDQG